MSRKKKSHLKNTHTHTRKKKINDKKIIGALYIR